MHTPHLAALSLALLAACVPAEGLDETIPAGPADPQLGIVSSSATPILGPYTHREPAEPGSWGELNQGQAPDAEGAE